MSSKNTTKLKTFCLCAQFLVRNFLFNYIEFFSTKNLKKVPTFLKNVPKLVIPSLLGVLVSKMCSMLLLLLWVADDDNCAVVAIAFSNICCINNISINNSFYVKFCR